MQPMQAGFGKLVARLQSVDYNILDVRNMAWYDDFSAFRSSVRSLEVRLSNVMQLAVDSAGSLSAHVELLEARQAPFVLFSPGLPCQSRPQDRYLTCRPDCMCVYVCVCVCVNLLAVPARVPIKVLRVAHQVAMTCSLPPGNAPALRALCMSCGRPFAPCRTAPACARPWRGSPLRLRRPSKANWRR